MCRTADLPVEAWPVMVPAYLPSKGAVFAAHMRP